MEDPLKGVNMCQDTDTMNSIKKKMKQLTGEGEFGDEFAARG